MTSNRDLSGYESSESIEDAFSALVSGGKQGYKAVIERKKVPPKCVKCGRGGDPDQKFCPQCGGQMKTPLTNCPDCKNPIKEEEKFCTECGINLQENI